MKCLRRIKMFVISHNDRQTTHVCGVTQNTKVPHYNHETLKCITSSYLCIFCYMYIIMLTVKI